MRTAMELESTPFLLPWLVCRTDIDPDMPKRPPTMMINAQMKTCCVKLIAFALGIIWPRAGSTGAGDGFCPLVCPDGSLGVLSVMEPREWPWRLGRARGEATQG